MGSDPYSDAAKRDIRIERERQVSVEGWTAEHDDGHDDGSLLRAAVIYLWYGTLQGPAIRDDGAPVSWPWNAKWWKPKSRHANLVRAGALCLAERDRLVRAGRSPAPAKHKLRLAVRELAALKAADAKRREQEKE